MPKGQSVWSSQRSVVPFWQPPLPVCLHVKVRSPSCRCAQQNSAPGSHVSSPQPMPSLFHGGGGGGEPEVDPDAPLEPLEPDEPDEPLEPDDPLDPDEPPELDEAPPDDDVVSDSLPSAVPTGVGSVPETLVFGDDPDGAVKRSDGAAPLHATTTTAETDAKNGRARMGAIL